MELNDLPKDYYKDTAKSERDWEDNELDAVNFQTSSPLPSKKKKKNNEKKNVFQKGRPKSGYLFPTTLAKNNQNELHKALFNMQYFEDSHSSLNKSFIETDKDEENEAVSTNVVCFKYFCLVISIIWNSAFFVLPTYVVVKFYPTEPEAIQEPVIINWWRFQCTTLCFAVLMVIRRIWCLDDYFRAQRWSRLMIEGAIAGFALCVWSTGIMYSAQMSSMFSAYLLSYSFPVIISGVILLLGATVLRTGTQNVSPSDGLNSNAQNNEGSYKSYPSLSASFLNVRSKIKSHHSSYNEKIGVSIFFLGLLIMVFAAFIAYGDQTLQRSNIIAGDVIAFFSAIFGIIFHYIFMRYSMKQLYRIIEFLFTTYLFAAIFTTATNVLFLDTSDYKLMSFAGWAFYSKDHYWTFMLCGGINTLGSQLSRIVKVEKFINSSFVFYAYLAQPLISTVLGYLLLPNIFDLPGIYTIIGGFICTIGLYALSRS